MSDYDSWKLATPWDGEVAMTVSFDCDGCGYYNGDVDAIGSRGSDEVIVYCYECDAENTVDVGE
jgi:C4-type Zn-finger protein